jgi:hypothetical protein
MVLKAEFIIEHVNNIIEYVPHFTVCNLQCKQQHAGMYNDMDCNIHDRYKGKDSQDIYAVSHIFTILIKVDISVK